MTIAPCAYCGRLTADAEGTCSQCQQRKKAMPATPPKPSKLDYWKDRADELALTSGKAQVVIEHSNGSCQVWPKSLVGATWNVVHDTGGVECV